MRSLFVLLFLSCTVLLGAEEKIFPKHRIGIGAPLGTILFLSGGPRSPLIVGGRFEYNYFLQENISLGGIVKAYTLKESGQEVTYGSFGIRTQRYAPPFAYGIHAGIASASNSTSGNYKASDGMVGIQFAWEHIWPSGWGFTLEPSVSYVFGSNAMLVDFSVTGVYNF